jgi:hypothetical protein
LQQQGDGGAVFVFGADVAVTNTTFKGNTANNVSKSTPVLWRGALVSINALRFVVAHKLCNLFCF